MYEETAKPQKFDRGLQYLLCYHALLWTHTRCAWTTASVMVLRPASAERLGAADCSGSTGRPPTRLPVQSLPFP